MHNVKETYKSNEGVDYTKIKQKIEELDEHNDYSDEENPKDDWFVKSIRWFCGLEDGGDSTFMLISLILFTLGMFMIMVLSSIGDNMNKYTIPNEPTYTESDIKFFEDKAIEWKDARESKFNIRDYL